MSADVVKLPTAARRQVQQPQNKLARAAKAQLREQQGRAFPYRHSTMREADKIAAAIHPMTPERWLLLSIVKVMDTEAFAKIAIMGHVGHPTINALIRFAKGSFGLQIDVMAALEQCRTGATKGGEA